jgi:hypothetical protein
VASVRIYVGAILQPPTSSRKGGALGGPAPSQIKSAVFALRTRNAYVGLVRRVRNEKVAHKTFVGNLFADHRHLCPARGVNQGRWVYEGSRSLGQGKINVRHLTLVFSCPSPANSLGARQHLA